MTRPDARRAVAVATIGLDGFGDENFEYAFDLIPRLGIRRVELNCWYGRNLTPSGIESIRVRCAERDLLPVSLHLPGFSSAGNADHAREVARWLWVLEAADRLGIGLIKATGSARGTAGGLEGVIDVLRQITPVAADRGVTIALENHVDNVLELPEDYRRIFEAVPSETIGMCLDTGHFTASGVDMIAVVDELGDRIVHVDLKDCASSQGREDFVGFGEGIVDFDAVLGRLVERDYSGLLLVEFPRRSLDTVIDDLTAGARIARRYTTEDD
jgi:sugar phosphate isomerase/epimerase